MLCPYSLLSCVTVGYNSRYRAHNKDIIQNVNFGHNSLLMHLVLIGYSLQQNDGGKQQLANYWDNGSFKTPFSKDIFNLGDIFSR